MKGSADRAPGATSRTCLILSYSPTSSLAAKHAKNGWNLISYVAVTSWTNLISVADGKNWDVQDSSDAVIMEAVTSLGHQLLRQRLVADADLPETPRLSGYAEGDSSIVTLSSYLWWDFGEKVRIQENLDGLTPQSFLNTHIH